MPRLRRTGLNPYLHAPSCFAQVQFYYNKIIILIIIILLIDVAVPEDRNVIKKEAEKILKYKDLIIKVQRMWNAKTIVTQVIIGLQEPFQNHSLPEQHTRKTRN